MWGTIINTSDNNRMKNDGKDAIGLGRDLDCCGLTGGRMCSSSRGRKWSCKIMRQWSMRGTRITGKHLQNHQHIRGSGVGRAGQRSHDERTNRGGITLQTARDIRNCSGSVRGIRKSLCTGRRWFAHARMPAVFGIARQAAGVASKHLVIHWRQMIMATPKNRLDATQKTDRSI